MDTSVALSTVAFLVILALLTLLRAKYSTFEVKPTDAVIAIIPVVLYLLVSGRIASFALGELKIETAFKNASTSAIAGQVTPLVGLPSEPVRIDSKAGVEEIPRLIEKKTEGLLFRLGYGGYYGPAIRDYLTLLLKYPFLRYIVIENPDRTFLAMADARALSGLLTSERPPYTADDFARWLNASDRSSLKRLPGFIAAEQAVTKTTDKSQALQRMESLNVDTLPVVDNDKRYAGIVNRSRLTASLILDMANELHVGK